AVAEIYDHRVVAAEAVEGEGGDAGQRHGRAAVEDVGDGADAAAGRAVDGQHVVARSPRNHHVGADRGGRRGRGRRRAGGVVLEGDADGEGTRGGVSVAAADGERAAA